VIDAGLQKAKESAAYVQQRNASAILLTTEAAGRRLSFADRWKAPVHFLPHGIDSDFFCPAAPGTLRRQSEGQTILFYANIAERKGVLEMLRAFELISPEFPTAKLWIAGDGDQLDTARDFASGLDAHNQIQFLGRQTREQAVLLMQQSDLFCLTSHGEPYGMTVVEAMGCGLPVIVTDAGGVRYLPGEDGGLRVPVRSPSAVAEALARLLADPQLCKQMGLRNRQRVLQSFEWERVIDRLEDIYGTIIEGERESQAAIRLPGIHLAEDLSSRGERR
jgi:glycosyltransferase involved in cell wall biosynthesis